MGKRNRRGHGEGSIFRLADGKWAGEIDLGTVDGKRQRRRVQAKTQAEAKERLRQLQAHLHATAEPPNTSLTVQQHLTDWLRVVQRTRTPNTHSVYEQAARLYLIPALGSTRLSDLTLAQVEAVLAQMAADGKRRSFIGSVRATLRTALRDAERRYGLPRNVAALAPLPAAATPPKARRALGPADARRLLTALQGDRFETAILVMLSLGLRRGECFALRWADLDATAGTLRIRGNLQWHDGRWQVRPTKTKASTDTLPLPPVLLRRLLAHQEDQQRQKAAAGDRWTDQGFCFTTATGGPVPERTFSQHLARLLADHDLPTLSPHALRHSCATLLFAQGVAPKLIQAILRHTRIGTTLDLYSHLLPGMTAAALTGMDRMLAGAERKPDDPAPSAEEEAEEAAETPGL